ncbi:MAG: hypothetical protein JNK89_02405, partial [Saprospiraceae bacterium]|nr:hypothetical protein [Saprospiraceae bacterium]
MKQTFQNGVLLLVFILAPLACQQDQAVRQPEHYLEASALLEKWHQLLLELERFTPGYRPPVTARMWSYVEMAAWQAALPGIPEATDLSVFVNGLPEAQRYSGQYFLPAGLNAAYAEIFRQFFPTAPSHLAEKINMLEEECLRGGGKKVHSAVLSRSVAYGKKIARDIWVWSTTDTIGHEGDQHNYDAQYRSPDGAGCWRPDGVHHTAALLPYWGMSRSMVVRPSDIGILPPLRYDTRPGTPFHVQAMEVLAMSKPLTNEYRWLAEFWSDDVPGLTVS